MNIAVGFYAVEDLVNATNASLSKKELKGTATLGAEMGNLADGFQKRWTISHSVDVHAVAKSICDYVIEHGFPDLERYQSMEEAFGLLNRENRGVVIHSPFPGNRASKAVALADLMKNQNVPQ